MRYCTKCGAELPDDSKFCGRCGNSVSETEGGESLRTITDKTVGGKNSKTPLFAGIGGVAVLAIVVIVLFATGVIGKKDEAVLKGASDAIDEDTYDISDEDVFTPEDIFSDTEDNSDGVTAENAVGNAGADTGTEGASDQIENPGEAVLTSSAVENIDFASKMKLNREQIRSKNKEALLEVINNTSITEAQKQEAVDAMIRLTDIAEREAAAEMLLEAKGFTDVVVSISDSNADVVLNMGEVTDAKRAQVEDIVKRKTQIAAENITITPIQ